jgi:hypothetical protein
VKTVRSEVLAEVLWGIRQPVNPANALQTQISYLRRQLATRASTQPIVTRPGGYALAIDRDDVDANRFDRAVQLAASAMTGAGHGSAEAMSSLDEALFRGGGVTRSKTWPASHSPPVRPPDSKSSGCLERRILDHDPTLVVAVAEDGDAIAVPTVAAVPHVAAVAWRLPAQISPLIGREGELERIGRLLDRSRAVTLTGPGGAGKIRLAVEAARSLSTAGEAWYVELGDVDDPGQVAVEVAMALALPTAPTGDPAMSVVVSLSNRHGVLLLDTGEHVVGAVATLVGCLLRDAPGVRVLATSRRPLNVKGEIAWPVPPLAPAAPDADLDDVSAICMALDGLPLAIELAAAPGWTCSRRG